MNSVSKNILLVISSLTASLLIAEATLRMIYSSQDSKNFEKIGFSLDSNAKPQMQYKLLTAGASSMYGEPYMKVFNIPLLLKEFLEKSNPKIKVELSDISAKGEYLSNGFSVIIEELQKKPDLFVLYIGNNAFQPDNYQHIACKHDNALNNICPNGLALCRAIKNVSYQLTVEAELSGVEPQDFFFRHPICPNQRKIVLEKYERQLSHLAKIAEENKIHMILVFPSGNEANLPPNRSFYSGLKSKSSYFWEAYQSGRRALKKGQFEKAKRYFLDALSIDSKFADLHFRLGEIELELGRLKSAQNYFRAAKNLDALPSRAIDKQLEAILRVQKKHPAVIVINSRDVFLEASKNTLIDFDVTIDLQHPNAKGYLAMAKTISKAIVENKLFDIQSIYEFPPLERLLSSYLIDDDLSNYRIHFSRALWFFDMAELAFDPIERYRQVIHHGKLALKYYHDDFKRPNINIPNYEHLSLDTNEINRIIKHSTSEINRLNKRWE